MSIKEDDGYVEDDSMLDEESRTELEAADLSDAKQLEAMRDVHDDVKWYFLAGAVVAVLAAVGYILTKIYVTDPRRKAASDKKKSKVTSVKRKARKVQMLVKVMKKRSDLFAAIGKWLKTNRYTTVNLDGFDVKIASAIAKELKEVKTVTLHRAGL